MIDLVLQGMGQFEVMSYRINRLIGSIDEVPKAVVKAFAKYVENEARAMIGHYQPAIENYPAWAPLSEITLRKRAAAGENATDAPLDATGEMRKAVTSEPMGRAGEHFFYCVGYAITPGVSRNDDGSGMYPAYHELEYGTEHMPPRPVFGPAVLRTADKLQTYVHKVVKSHFNNLAGYDFDSRWGDISEAG